MTQKHCLYLSSPFVVVLLISVLFVSTIANIQTSPGSITVTGRVKVNKRRVGSGFPIWPSATIDTTTKGSSAVVSLGKLGRLDVHEGAEVLIEFNDKRIVVTMLEDGQVRLSTPIGVGVTVRSINAQVVADTAQANEFRFDTSCGNIVVAVQMGKVSLRTGGRNPILKEIAAGSPETVGTAKRAGCE